VGAVLGFELGAYTLCHATLPHPLHVFLLFFVMGFFEIGSQEIFAWGWHQTMVLLIFVS
jgi:hypothetical protein